MIVFTGRIYSFANEIRHHQGISKKQRNCIHRGWSWQFCLKKKKSTEPKDDFGLLVYRSFTALRTSIGLSIFDSTEVFTERERERNRTRLTYVWHGHCSEMIYTVIEEYPEYAFVVRFKLAEMQILPDLITRLTVVYCRDTVSCLQATFMMSTLTVELALG